MSQTQLVNMRVAMQFHHPMRGRECVQLLKELVEYTLSYIPLGRRRALDLNRMTKVKFVADKVSEVLFPDTGIMLHGFQHKTQYSTNRSNLKGKITTTNNYQSKSCPHCTLKPVSPMSGMGSTSSPISSQPVLPVPTLNLQKGRLQVLGFI